MDLVLQGPERAPVFFRRDKLKGSSIRQLYQIGGALLFPELIDIFSQRFIPLYHLGGYGFTDLFYDFPDDSLVFYLGWLYRLNCNCHKNLHFLYNTLFLRF
jgi:hypothetical protein